MFTTLDQSWPFDTLGWYDHYVMWQRSNMMYAALLLDLQDGERLHFVLLYKEWKSSKPQFD